MKRKKTLTEYKLTLDLINQNINRSAAILKRRSLSPGDRASISNSLEKLKAQKESLKNEAIKREILNVKNQLDEITNELNDAKLKANIADTSNPVIKNYNVEQLKLIKNNCEIESAISCNERCNETWSETYKAEGILNEEIIKKCGKFLTRHKGKIMCASCIFGGLFLNSSSALAHNC